MTARRCQCCDRTAMHGTPDAARAVDPDNCPRCDHFYAVSLAGGPLDFRGVDSPVYVAPAPTAPKMGADELAELRDWAASRAAAAFEALDAEATPDAFRDDGTLYHGRLPSEDVDGFSPWIVARAEYLRPQILPAPITSIYPGMLLRVRSEVL